MVRVILGEWMWRWMGDWLNEVWMWSLMSDWFSSCCSRRHIEKEGTTFCIDELSLNPFPLATEFELRLFNENIMFYSCSNNNFYHKMKCWVHGEFLYKNSAKFRKYRRSWDFGEDGNGISCHLLVFRPEEDLFSLLITERVLIRECKRNEITNQSITFR